MRVKARVRVRARVKVGVSTDVTLGLGDRFMVARVTCTTTHTHYSHLSRDVRRHKCGPWIDDNLSRRNPRNHHLVRLVCEDETIGLIFSNTPMAQ